MAWLRIYGLSKQVTEDDVYHIIKDIAAPKRVLIARDRNQNNKCVGFAWIDLPCKADADRLLAQFQSSDYVIRY